MGAPPFSTWIGIEGVTSFPGEITLVAGIQLLTGIVSASLLFIGLWQIEMMWLHKSWNLEGFVLPFGRKVPWWFARDLWYSCIIAGYVLLIIVK